MNKNVKKALEVALDAEHPRRFHHEIARTGYEDGGLASPMDITHDRPYSSGPQMGSPFDVAKVSPYMAKGIDIPSADTAKIAMKSMKMPKASVGKIRIRKPKAIRPHKIRFAKGGTAIEDALRLASRTMSGMAKEAQDFELGAHGFEASQGSTSTIVKEKQPGKRAETIFERHEQTPVEHHAFSEPLDLHPDVRDALRLARDSGGIIRPGESRDYGADVKSWREERGRRGHKRDYNPWADRENMYTHPTEERHDPKDPMYYISPEEYQRGAYGRDTFALAHGGRAHMNVGGNPNPLLGSNPAIVPTPNLAVNAAVPMANATTPAIVPTPNLAVNAAVPMANATTSAIVPTPNLAVNAAAPMTTLPQGMTPTNTPTITPEMLDPNSSYVASLYQNILGRQADQPGLEFWSQKLTAGEQDPMQLLRDFANSGEFQEMYQKDPSKAVQSLYQTALARAPEQTGLDYWTQQAKGGLNLADMVSQFANSEEGEGVQFVNQLYRDYYGDMPTRAETQAGMEQISQTPDINDYIAKTFPVGTDLSGLPQEARNRANRVTDETFASRMGKYNPNEPWIKNTNWGNAEILKNSLSKIPGMTDEGLYSALGNFIVESAGMNPNRVEGVPSKPFRNKKLEANRQMRKGLSDVLNSDNWQNVDLGKLAKARLGIGLAQWTGDRAVNLINFAKDQGKSWKDMGVQSDFLAKELSDQYKSIMDYYRDNPNLGKMAVAAFEKRFENPNVGAGIRSAGERFNAAVAASQYFGAPETFGKYEESPLVMAAKQKDQSGGSTVDPALADVLAQQGAGGGTGGGGMVNPSGGFIGGTSTNPSPGFTPDVWQPAGQFSTTGASVISPIPGTGMPTWDYSTGYTGTSGGYMGGGSSGMGGFGGGSGIGSGGFSVGFMNKGGFVTKRALKTLKAEDEDAKSALRIAKKGKRG